MVIVCKDSVRRQLKSGKEKTGFYMNAKLKENLDYEVKRIKKGWDVILLVDGEEGSGKSSFASSIAYYLSSKLETKFELEDVIFTIPQFEEWVKEQPVGSVCLWDEFVMAGLSTEALYRIQNTLIKRMAIIRKKRLVIILVIPYLFMLRKYFALARTKCLLHVYSVDYLSRGTFMYYSKPKKRRLYIKGSKYWEHGVERPDFIGSFTDTYGFFWDVEKYEQKKEESLENISMNIQKDKVRKKFAIFLHNLHQKGMRWKEISSHCNEKAETMRSFTRQTLEKEGFKVGRGENIIYNPENKKK